MSAYIVTGFNSETGDRYHAEERDIDGAEHCLSTWLMERPIQSSGEVIEEHEDGKLTIVSKAVRVPGGLIWPVKGGVVCQS